MRPMMPWLALTLGLAACQTDRPTAASRAADLTSGNDGAVRVYTQNLYVGADVDKVIAAPPAQLPAALFQALATFVATDYPSRAGRMADEIGRQRPDLIGLQEVTHLTVQGLGIVGFPDIDVDFIPILSAQLAARGLHYDVVAVSPNTDITIPLPLPDGSFGDHRAQGLRRHPGPPRRSRPATWSPRTTRPSSPPRWARSRSTSCGATPRPT